MPDSTPQAASVDALDEFSARGSATADVHLQSGTRKRKSRACQMCYQKKTKCEVEESSPTCLQCLRRRTKCVFGTRKEKRDGFKRAQYARSLRDRLEKLESLLKTAGILDEDAVGQDELSNDDDDELAGEDCEMEDVQREESSDFSSNNSSTSHASPRPEESSQQSPYGGDLEHARLFKLDNRDESRYFGRSSSLSILSREGIEWIKHKTGDVSFLQVLFSDSSRDSPWDHWRPDVFHDLFATQVFKPLPSRSEVFSLLKDYFATTNRLFPIYHEATFMRMVEWQYTQQTCDDAARWASINVILSLAYEYRVSNNPKPEKDREKSGMYFKNAMSVLTELTLRRTDLLSVQALLGMALFLRANSGIQSTLPIVTAAMRSCQRMGLHRDIPRPGLSPAEREQRKRVFWIAYTLDQSTCLRAGIAPSQHPDDFDVALPEDMNDDEVSSASTNTVFFRQLCLLTVTRSRIYSQLYSTKALRRPPKEIHRTVKELHAELEKWKRQYPFSEPKQHVGKSGSPFEFASVGVHFIYYNALIMIHRIPLLLNYAYSRSGPDSSGQKQNDVKDLCKSQASKSAVICVQAARDTLKLVNNMPWGNISWIWSLLYYVFLAVATIFSNTIRDTHHPHAREDLQSLSMAAMFFSTLDPSEGQSHYAGFMTRMSANLERIARTVVEKNEKMARDPDGQDKERRPPGAKKPNSRAASASWSEPRRRSRSTAFQQHLIPTAPSAPTASTAADAHVPNISIPEAIEGLPPVNSSGYVVSMSPGDASAYPNSSVDNGVTTSTKTDYTSLDHTLDVAPIAATSDYSSGATAAWQMEQDYVATTSPRQGDTQSPYSINSGTGTTATGSEIPEFWQIPLTAEWEFGSNVWARPFPTVYDLATSSGTIQQTNTAGPHDPSPSSNMPILSAESFLEGAPATTSAGGAGFSLEDLGYSQTDHQIQAQASGQVWPSGFLGLFETNE